MDAKSTAVKAYCNVMAIQQGLDPVGHGAHFEDMVIFEIPLPWKNSIYQQADPLPQQVIDLMALWIEEYKTTGKFPHYSQFIASDKAYSREGFRRVMFYTRNQAQIATFDKVEYSVPVDQMGALIWALHQDRDALPQFEPFRTPEADTIRDLLVCTHGTVDAACAKFGYPLYNALRQQSANDAVRVWRINHFGGHLFAPTLLEMPSGHYWAYVEAEQGAQIAARDGEVAALRGHYRGWGGLPAGFLQAAECALWQHFGWKWLAYRRSGEIIAQEADTDKPQWADVEIHYTSPEGVAGVCAARVEIYTTLDAQPNTNSDHRYPYAQYTVTDLQIR